ncbi:outer membrane beta-barrel protein [Thioalkalivibrio sp. XN279]|uniref:outer membrane beta-barrel protein n=1 Tax=Thioalkalivibrio sp. XN279 TaxID=2714953 RepID=UPI00140BD682|nr:outer membrane beta-barrel protein [Thioalkalivibrio sp. XN279]NHA14634.1 outer membrane beta-barrel protein [Thioalkalivibrio sp. XN279]
MDNTATLKLTRRSGVPATALLVAVLLATPAPTYADSGFYLGGSLGRSFLEGDISDAGEGSVEFDDGASAWKGFAGFNIDAFVIDLAIEGGYVDFGAPSDRIAGSDVEFDLTGWDVFGLAGVELGPVGVFAKAGFIDWSADLSLDDTRIGSDSGTDPAYGIGARFSLFSAEVRAEYEYFDVEDTDVSLVSVGVVWTF